MNPRVLITGAAGRVGQLLTPLLRQSYSLRLCDVKPIPHGLPEDELLQGDLADPAFTSQAAAGVSAVVHLAGLVASQVSFEDTLSPNYLALLQLLAACRHQSIPRFVFASSHHILGLLPSNQTYTESAPIAPDGFYALSKAFGEAACAMYAHRFGIRTLIIRIGNADPQVSDARRQRLWVSARDLAQLISIGLTHPAISCQTVYGVSNCPSPLFPNHEALRLGYQPLDHPANHLSPIFRSIADLTPADGFDKVGGPFAADPL